MKIIARIHSDFPTKFGVPRQSGLASELESSVVFEPSYRNPDALRALDGFSHIWLLWQFDRVEIYIEEDDETQTIQLVTTLRQNALEGRISKESPVGRAVLGHRVGDRVEVETDSGYRYFIQIRRIEKGTDDASLPISSY